MSFLAPSCHALNILSFSVTGSLIPWKNREYKRYIPSTNKKILLNSSDPILYGTTSASFYNLSNSPSRKLPSRGLTFYEKTLLESCKKEGEENEQEISAEFTFDEYKKVFNRTKEYTASSPSGLHIGHYKLGCLYPTIGKILSRITSIPLEYGFSIRCWQHATHVMLEKQPGFPLSTSLRNIQITEADLNAALKVKIGKQTMNSKTGKSIIGTNMHGGIKKRSTTDAIITQILLLDIANYFKYPTTIMSMDAEKCFDRIPPHIANIAMR